MSGLLSNRISSQIIQDTWIWPDTASLLDSAKLAMQLFWLGLNYYNQNCFLAQAFELFCINRLQGKFI